MNITIDQNRLARVTHLYSGSHEAGSDKMCVMEAVAYVTHKDWSDHPPCVSPVIGAFMRAWNDGLPDDERTILLKPFIPKLVNTRNNKQIERRRACMAADWLIRVHAPAWLRLAKLTAQAALLESFPEITDFTQCPSLMPALTAVRNDAAAASAAAWVAARAAASDAASAAAWDAAWAAAWAAARAAAGAAAGVAAAVAAWDAAWAAAWDAASDAAWDAASDAAGAAASVAARDALTQTRKELQASAARLVERMIAAE